MLDLDQQAIEIALGADDFTKAKAIYTGGGNSGARATLTVPATTVALTRGAIAMQSANGVSNSSRGTVYQNYGSGVTSVKITYDSTSAASCVHNTAGFPGSPTSKCFTTTAGIVVAGSTISTPTAVANTYRTLQGFSTGVEAKFTAMAADRQVYWLKYKNYYTSGTYADTYVMGALDGTGVWAGKTVAARKQGVKKGTVFMNNWMYVIREFEDAIHDCKAACATCNMDAVHAWDEGVAFYTGSLEGLDPHGKQGGSCTASSSTGCMLHMLADKRCTNYKTCDGNDNSGPSLVNKALFDEFAFGRDDLQAQNCDNAVVHLNRIVSLMTVPLIQGALRYAYKVSVLNANPGDVEKAEGAVFSAAVLPMIHACSAADATVISDNMKIDSASPMSAGFAAVKTAFENTYTCLGITCADVGGLLQTATAYYPDFQPCTPAQQTTSFAKSSGSIGLLLVCIAYAIFW
jgi:hypothetical protein